MLPEHLFRIILLVNPETTKVYGISREGTNDGWGQRDPDLPESQKFQPEILRSRIEWVEWYLLGFGYRKYIPPGSPRDRFEDEVYFVRNADPERVKADRVPRSQTPPQRD